MDITEIKHANLLKKREGFTRFASVGWWAQLLKPAAKVQKPW